MKRMKNIGITNLEGYPVEKAIAFLFLFLPLMSSAQVDLGPYFKSCQVEGSITIFDYKNQSWIFSDEKDARRETLPASTFKIINSMITLETGVVRDEKEVRKWDGKERTHQGVVIKAWNSDMDMESAFKNSTVWFYVEMARAIGPKMYDFFLKRSNYGNGRITEGKDGDFWNYGPFGISPRNQVEFLIGLYEEDLPFSKRTFSIVKGMMEEERNARYTLRAKTGWSSDGFDNGWWVGYVETRDNVFFFATRITKPLNVDNPAFGDCRKSITRKVLADLGLVSW